MCFWSLGLLLRCTLHVVYLLGGNVWYYARMEGKARETFTCQCLADDLSIWCMGNLTGCTKKFKTCVYLSVYCLSHTLSPVWLSIGNDIERFHARQRLCHGFNPPLNRPLNLQWQRPISETLKEGKKNWEISKPEWFVAGSRLGVASLRVFGLGFSGPLTDTLKRGLYNDEEWQ